jgi:hypothetical protein
MPLLMMTLLNGIIVVGERATADKILLLHHPVVVCVTRAVRFLSARRRLRSKRNERRRKAFNTMRSFFYLRRHTTTKISLPRFWRESFGEKKRLFFFLKGGWRAQAYNKIKSGF